jgi:hypothetical protein
MGRNFRWSVVAASPKLRLFQASQTVRGEKIKTAALRKLTYSPAKAAIELLSG